MSTNASDTSPLSELTALVTNRIGPIITPLLASASTFLEKTWLTICWEPLFYLFKKYYLLGPQWLGGMENRPPEDICSNILGVPSTVLFTELGQKICQDKIDNKVISFVTVVVALVVAILSVNAFVFLKSRLFVRVQHQNNHNHNNRNSYNSSSSGNSSSSSSGSSNGSMDQMIELMNLRKFARWSMLKVYQVKACKEILHSNMSQTEQINALRTVLFPAGRRQRGSNTLLLGTGPYDGLPIDSDQDDEDDDMLGFPGVIIPPPPPPPPRNAVIRREAQVVVAAVHEEEVNEEKPKKPTVRGRRKTIDTDAMPAADAVPRRASSRGRR